MLSMLLLQVAKPDFTQLGVDAITALTPIATVLVLWAFKSVWQKVPASIIVFAAPVLGILLNYAISLVTGLTADSVIVAALLGAVGTWLREIVSTIQAKGFGGAVTPTKGML